LTFSTCSLDRRPCFVCAAIDRALPSGVRGPVEQPPCNRHLFRPLSAAFWQGVLRRVLVRHRRPGQSTPKRVAMPASTIHEVRRSVIALGPRLMGLTLSHNPRTTALGPLLQRRETRRTDGFPVTRLMLFEQAVADQ